MGRRDDRRFEDTPQTGAAARRLSILLLFCTKSAHQIDDKADQQNQTKPASADGGPSKVKTAAAEQKKKDNYQKNQVHGCKIALRDNRHHGAFTHQELSSYGYPGGRQEMSSNCPVLRSWEAGHG